jgi:hypothetical protein
VFFDSVKKVSLEPFGDVNVSVEIDKSRISKLIAGPYIFNAGISVDDASVSYEGIINYLEKEDSAEKKESSGILTRETKIIRENTGNVPISGTIEIKKDIISRLFTSFSESPLSSERKGLIVEYSWEKNLGPGESFVIVITTNYTFIAILIVLVVLIGFLVWLYSLTAIKLHKSVSFVKTKGGEFALKVKIRVKARKSVDGLKIIDRLPYMTKLYEGFGKKPDKIDEASRRLFWDVLYLNRGEERVFSYIIYSKLRAMGRFELPSARAMFEKDGKKQEVVSNKAYFVSESMSEGENGY